MKLCDDCLACRRDSCRLLAAARAAGLSPFDIPHDIPPGFRVNEREAVYFPLLCEAWRVLSAQPAGYWRSMLLWQLRSVRIRVTPLTRPGRDDQLNNRGRTIPLLSLAIDLREDVAAASDAGSLQVLLHELAHRCGAVLPEWKLWFPRLYPRESVYGRRVNSADAISMSMIEHYCPACRWPDWPAGMPQTD